MMQTERVRYLSVTETAKLVRRALRESFPGVKFSVRSDSYAGGASIRVGWTDGPRRADVGAVTDQFEGKSFDGSIDLAYSKTHWLRPDGRVLLQSSPGTVGSRGSHPAIDNTDLTEVIPEDAELVHLGANYIFCDRELSDREGKRAEAEHWVREHCVIDAHRSNSDLDRFGGYYVSDLALSLAYDRIEGESWEQVWDRR